MMNTINPSVAEIDATINFLSILELAKDASKLKEALSTIKAEKDAAAAERKAAQLAKEDVAAGQAALEDMQAQLERDRAKLKQDQAASFKTSEELDAASVAMREERDRFDRWMAGEREALANLRARVDSDAAANKRRAEDLMALEAKAAVRERDADAAIAAADAKRAEYEAKIASLKAMVQ
jgi:predicted  nucleic acid-binding Zn-ribbon protein